MKVSSSKYKAMVFNWKKRECSLWVRDESLPQAEEFKCLGIMSNGKSVRWTDGLGLSGNDCTPLVTRGKEEAFNLLVYLCSNPHLSSQVMASDRKNKVENTSG